MLIIVAGITPSELPPSHFESTVLKTRKSNTYLSFTSISSSRSSEVPCLNFSHILIGEPLSTPLLGSPFGSSAGGSCKQINNKQLLATLLPAMADCCCQNLSNQLFRDIEAVADILLRWCSVFGASELEVMLERHSCWRALVPDPLARVTILAASACPRVTCKVPTTPRHTHTRRFVIQTTPVVRLVPVMSQYWPEDQYWPQDQGTSVRFT